MLFGRKEKKSTIDEILDLMDKLTDEERAELKSKIDLDDEPTTEAEINKAEEDIDEKGKDTQSEKDRVDESVGVQEAETGTEDSQDAKDRVDESEGMEEADETPAPVPETPETPPVEETPEEEPTPEAPQAPESEDNGSAEILARLEALEAKIDELVKANGNTSKPASDEEASKLERITALYNN